MALVRRGASPGRALRSREQIIWSNLSLSRFHNVVPFAVKIGRRNSYGGHLCVADFQACFVHIGVQGRLDSQAGGRCCACDQLDNRLATQQPLAPPVAGDVTEQPMFDFGPLAVARRKMTNGQFHFQLFDQALQSHSPQAALATIAAAAVGRDHQFARPGKTPVAHVVPPATDAVGRVISARTQARAIARLMLPVV